MQTINNHFYYFACDEYPEIIPFEYDGNSLIFGTEPLQIAVIQSFKGWFIALYGALDPCYSK